MKLLRRLKCAFGYHTVVFHGLVLRHFNADGMPVQVSPRYCKHCEQAFMPMVAYNIEDFGADLLGESDSTAAIQMAIDAAAGDGGGQVSLPVGQYRTGKVVIG